MSLLHHEIIGAPGTIGATTPLCILPGLGNDLQVWTPFAEKLHRRLPSLPVLLLDNLGAGRSLAPPPPYSIEEMAADVLALLDHLHLPHIHLLGHSMGGMIALHLAATHPRRVGGLLLCSSAARLSRRNALLFEHVLHGLRSGVSPEWITRELFFWLLSPQTLEAPDGAARLDALVRETMDNPFLQTLNGLAGQIRAIADFEVYGELGRIQAPTLVIHGSDDPLITPQETAPLARCIAGAKLYYLEHTGHLPHLEAPERLLELVLEFLKHC